MYKLNLFLKKNYYKIGLFLIIIATFLSIILLPILDIELTNLEKKINDSKDHVMKNILAWLQNTIIGNRIELFCLRSDLTEENKKATLDQRIFIQSAILAKTYSSWWSSGKEQKKLEKEVEEKIRAINNSNYINEVKIQKIMSLIENERSVAFKRMNDFQDELEIMENRLKNKQLIRNNIHLFFACVQILGLIIISLRQIIKG